MRPDSARLDFLDGLRAVAILSVVGFHVGLPGLSGGFTGVDVFFVLSGFLIIGQIWDGLRDGTFSFSDFYARRALRILPPFLLVLLVSIVVASFVLFSADEINEFRREIKASALMVINHYFLQHEGYFDTASDLKPLLNMWSLAVEEQFYLVIPAAMALFVAALRRGWARAAWAGVALLSLASLAGAVILSGGEKNHGFYLAACRAWEFVAGGLIWLLPPVLAKVPRAAIDAIGAVGAALVLGSVVTLSEALAYPSWLALLPVAGTAAIIAACLARPRSWLCRALSVGPLCAIGLISYSWYLWHWPLLTFGRIYRFGDRDLAADLVVAGISACLAVATWWLVERPIRIRRHALLARIRPGFIVTCSLVACAAPYALSGARLSIHPKIIDQTAEAERRAVKNAMHNDACYIGRGETASARCLKELSGRKWGLLMGDSFAETSYPKLKALADRNDVRLVTIQEPGCRPLLDTAMRRNGSTKPSCTIFNETIATVTTWPTKPEFAVLRSHWHTDYHILGGADDADESQRIEAGLEKTLRKLADLGTRRILIVGTQPNQQRRPDCIDRMVQRGRSPSLCARAAKDVVAQERTVAMAIDKAAATLPIAHVVHPTEVLCPGAACLFTIDDKPAFRDPSHLTQAGEGVLFTAFANDFRWSVAGDTPAPGATAKAGRDLSPGEAGASRVN